jgi:hypothetical protein
LGLLEGEKKRSNQSTWRYRKMEKWKTPSNPQRQEGIVIMPDKGRKHPTKNSFPSQKNRMQKGMRERGEGKNKRKENKHAKSHRSLTHSGSYS